MEGEGKGREGEGKGTGEIGPLSQILRSVPGISFWHVEILVKTGYIQIQSIQYGTVGVAWRGAMKLCCYLTSRLCVLQLRFSLVSSFFVNRSSICRQFNLCASSLRPLMLNPNGRPLLMQKINLHASTPFCLAPVLNFWNICCSLNLQCGQYSPETNYFMMAHNSTLNRFPYIVLFMNFGKLSPTFLCIHNVNWRHSKMNLKPCCHAI